MSLIPTKQPWKVQMPDRQEPKKPGGSMEELAVYLFLIGLTFAIGITIGVFLGGIWPWPFS